MKFIMCGLYRPPMYDHPSHYSDSNNSDRERGIHGGGVLATLDGAGELSVNTLMVCDDQPRDNCVQSWNVRLFLVACLSIQLWLASGVDATGVGSAQFILEY